MPRMPRHGRHGQRVLHRDADGPAARVGVGVFVVNRTQTTTLCFTFLGQVSPRPWNVSIPPATIRFADQSVRALRDLQIDLTVENSRVAAQVRSFEPIADLATVRYAVEHEAQNLVDVMGFLKAQCFSVDIDRIVSDDGTVRYFSNYSSVEVSDLIDEPLGEGVGFLSIVDVQKRSPYLRTALADLRDSIRRFNDTPLYAYRAIESIRQHYQRNKKDNDRGRRQAWEEMRQDLDLNISELRLVADASRYVRHGQQAPSGGIERVELVRIAWKVVYRFWRRVAGDRI